MSPSKTVEQFHFTSASKISMEIRFQNMTQNNMKRLTWCSSQNENRNTTLARQLNLIIERWMKFKTKYSKLSTCISFTQWWYIILYCFYHVYWMCVQVCTIYKYKYDAQNDFQMSTAFKINQTYHSSLNIFILNISTTFLCCIWYAYKYYHIL